MKASDKLAVTTLATIVIALLVEIVAIVLNVILAAALVKAIPIIGTIYDTASKFFTQHPIVAWGLLLAYLIYKII